MSQVVTRNYEFTFILSGVGELTAEVADALFEAGCDDSSPWSEGSAVYLTFHREAESLGDAIGSAVKCVERAGYGVTRVAIESDESSESE